MKIEDLLSKLKQVKSAGEDRWMAICPAHDDKNPTLSIRKSGDRILLRCFADCRIDSILSYLDIKSRDLFDDNQTEWKGNSSINSAVASVKTGKTPPIEDPESEVKPTLALLSKKFKLPIDHLKSIGLADCSRGVEIPYCDFDGSPVFSRHRIAMGGKRKVMQPKGATLIPYGRERLAELRKLPEHKRSLVIPEGESDCWTLWRCGIPALGLPGASSTKCLEAVDVKRIARIFAIQESDEAGGRFVESLKKRLDEIGWDGEYRVIRMMAPLKDPAELWQSNPRNFKETFTNLAIGASLYGEQEEEDLLDSLTYRVDKIDRQQVSFLWEPYIPKAVLTMFAGAPGLGKSFVSCSLAALVSSGDYLPGSEIFGESGPCPAQRVLMFCTEDNPRTTVRPRLEDCGANMQNIRIFSGRDKDGKEVKLSFGDSGFATLKKLISKWKPSLVIFDPMISSMGSKINMNNQNEVRQALEPLIRIAEEFDIAIVLIAHATKGDLATVMGSQDFTAAPRSVIIAHPDPEIEHGEDGLLLVHAKKNLTRGGRTWRIRINGSRVQWVEAIDVNLGEIRAATEAKTRSRVSPADVMAWLREEMRHGSTGGAHDAAGLWWMPLAILMQRASRYGYQRDMVHAARGEMGNVVQQKRGDSSSVHWAIDTRAGGEDRNGIRIKKQVDFGEEDDGDGGGDSRGGTADW